MKQNKIKNIGLIIPIVLLGANMTASAEGKHFCVEGICLGDSVSKLGEGWEKQKTVNKCRMKYYAEYRGNNKLPQTKDVKSDFWVMFDNTSGEAYEILYRQYVPANGMNYTQYIESRKLDGTLPNGWRMSEEDSFVAAYFRKGSLGEAVAITPAGCIRSSGETFDKTCLPGADGYHYMLTHKTKNDVLANAIKAGLDECFAKSN